MGIREARSQERNITSSFKPDSYNFNYQISDSVQYVGSAWICTMPFGAYITKATWDKSAKKFGVEGFFAVRSTQPDTSLGQDGAAIFLFNPSTGRVRDLGYSLSKKESGKGFDGYFNVQFEKETGNVLIIGIKGRLGVATAFELDKILKRVSK
jgi:hypothetical protein